MLSTKSSVAAAHDPLPKEVRVKVTFPKATSLIPGVYIGFKPLAPENNPSPEVVHNCPLLLDALPLKV